MGKLESKKWSVVSGQWSVRNKRKLATGFTLLELMVTVAIIVLLAGILVPNLAKRIERAKVTSAEADIAAIETAIAMYETDLGAYPPGNGDITMLKNWLTGTGGVVTTGTDWSGPYIKGISEDPWGTEYVYYQNTDPGGSPIQGSDWPQDGDGGCVAPPNNLHYYIYSKGKNRITSNDVGGDGKAYEATPDATDGDDHDDDINNWDVNKSWKDAY
ncbi:MAG TPA: prepilin-type N-terminal cleavage/methylation domain-containing protein [Candidatus Omnitrophica bacterium]|nr:prepilin-type N-terminal cleavage/methylation domain-containing protein [Candidatus Omnitrophota bacterium]